MEQRATNQRKSQPVTSPNVLRPASRETSYLRERPVGCFSTFLFFWGSISLHQIQLDWPLIYYYPPLLYLWAGSLSLTGWKTHCTFVFSSRTCFYISRAAVQKSHPRNKDIIAFLWYVHTVFSCQGYLGFFSAAGCAYHLFWMAARNVGSQRRDVSTSLLCSLVKSLCSQVDEEPRLILQIRTFCNIAWSDCNLIDLPAPPLDLIRSMLSPWSRPAEMDNCGGATTNCLPCEALTCLYLLGLQCRFGKRWQCVCASACVCVSVAGAGGIRVTVQFSEPPSAARGDGKKKKRETTKWGWQALFQHFHIAMFYNFAKTGEQRVSTTLTTDWLTDSLEKTVSE